MTRPRTALAALIASVAILGVGCAAIRATYATRGGGR